MKNILSGMGLESAKEYFPAFDPVHATNDIYAELVENFVDGKIPDFSKVKSLNKHVFPFCSFYISSSSDQLMFNPFYQPRYSVTGMFNHDNNGGIKVDVVFNELFPILSSDLKKLAARIVGCIAHELVHMGQMINDIDIFVGTVYNMKNLNRVNWKKYINSLIEIDAFAMGSVVESMAGVSVSKKPFLMPILFSREV